MISMNLSDGSCVAIGDFVRRQTKGSAYSYYDGSWEDVVRLVVENWDSREPGYREGVVLVPVPADHFYSMTVQAGEHGPQLRAIFGARRDGEKGFVRVFGQNCKPLPACYVRIVCYHRDVLVESGEKIFPGVDWEIISLNASVQENEPMHPITMARNFLGKPGGSNAIYTAEQFAESIWYWMDKVQVDPSEAKMRFELAPRVRVLELEPYVKKILIALGCPEMLVTDESTVGDLPGETTTMLWTWMTVSGSDFIVDLAQRLKKRGGGG